MYVTTSLIRDPVCFCELGRLRGQRGWISTQLSAQHDRPKIEQTEDDVDALCCHGEYNVNIYLFRHDYDDDD